MRVGQRILELMAVATKRGYVTSDMLRDTWGTAVAAKNRSNYLRRAVAMGFLELTPDVVPAHYLPINGWEERLQGRAKKKAVSEAPQKTSLPMVANSVFSLGRAQR